jgi:hypothetical protein
MKKLNLKEQPIHVQIVMKFSLVIVGNYIRNNVMVGVYRRVIILSNMEYVHNMMALMGTLAYIRHISVKHFLL